MHSLIGSPGLNYMTSFASHRSTHIFDAVHKLSETLTKFDGSCSTAESSSGLISNELQDCALLLNLPGPDREGEEGSWSLIATKLAAKLAAEAPLMG